MLKKLLQSPAPIVAQKLLGATLSHKHKQGLITETEAYRGADDPASHAYKGPTPRSKIMFGPSGVAYVYLIYGMHHCLNIVTEPEGTASAVLIRGVLLPDGTHLNGPGKVCKYFGITRQHHNGQIINTPESLQLSLPSKTPPFSQTPRIGIKKEGLDKLWRYVLKTP